MNNQILPYDFIKLKDEITINGIYTFFYQEKDVSFIFPGETHDFWELIYMDKGFAYLLIDDKGFKINQGELFFFNKNQNHIVWSDSNVAPFFLTVSFNMYFQDEKFFEFKRFRVTDDIKEIIVKMINERHNAFEGDINTSLGKMKNNALMGAEQLIKIYLTELLIKL